MSGKLDGRVALVTGAASGIAALDAARARFVTGTELVVDGGRLADGGATRLPETMAEERA